MSCTNQQMSASRQSAVPARAGTPLLRGGAFRLAVLTAPAGAAFPSEDHGGDLQGGRLSNLVLARACAQGSILLEQTRHTTGTANTNRCKRMLASGWKHSVLWCTRHPATRNTLMACYEAPKMKTVPYSVSQFNNWPDASLVLHYLNSTGLPPCSQ